MSDLTEKAKLNVVGTIAFVTLMFYFGACTIAVVQEKITFLQFAATVGPLVGTVMGWVGKIISDQKQGGQ